MIEKKESSEKQSTKQMKMTSTGVQHHIGENGQIEVVRNPSLGMLLSCGGGGGMNNSFMHSHSDSEYDEEDNEDDGFDESRDELPNRRDSLMEDDDDDDEDDESIDVPKEIVNITPSEEEKRSYHPALKPAVLAEGQEAMWVEDEVSTVASVLVKPQETVEKPKKKNRFRFRPKLPAITIPEDEEVNHGEEHAQKVHVRKTKVRKTVVLLPQKGDDGADTLVEANVRQEAAMNMVRARQLLNQALVAEDGGHLEESESMAKVAFAHATAARRLMSKPEEEPDLEEVLSVLAEKGENAAFQHQKIVFSQAFESTPVGAQKPKKKSVLSSASQYASRAIHYLESILPTNVEKDLQESVSNDDIMPMQTISTLGFKSDTFEYQMESAPSQPTKSYTNMDLMSISSLNEILDGPIDESNDNKLPSPRQVMPVIKIPNCTPKTKPSNDLRVPRSSSGEIGNWRSPESHFANRPSRGDEHDFLFDTVKNEVSAPAENESRPKEAAERSGKEHKEPKKKKKWGILRKLRRGKQPKQQDQNEEVEKYSGKQQGGEKQEREEQEGEKHASDEAEVELRSRDPTALNSFPTGPTESFESETPSKFSRYHVIREGPTEDSGSTKESVPKDESQQYERIDRLDTVKSDWDHTSKFQRSKVKTDHAIIQAPARSKSLDLEQTESDWDEALNIHSRKMKKKPILDLESEESISEEETQKRKTTPSRKEKNKSTIHTPASRLGTSVESQRTKDFRSIQGNTGATVAESETTGMWGEAETVGYEDNMNSSATEQSGSKGQSSHTASILNSNGQSSCTASALDSKGQSSYTANISQKPVYRKMPKPLVDEDSTQEGEDSLIDFVISPRRASIITPEGRRHIESDRGDEPSKILIPTLYAIEEGHVVGPEDTTTTSVHEAESNTHYNLQQEEPHHKHPKFITRISSLFGARRSKGQSRDESIDAIEKQDSFDKEINHALADGNVKAYEANLNAENGSCTQFTKQVSQYPSPPSAYTQSIEESKENTMELYPSDSTTVVEGALNQAVLRAEEANMEVDTAPFPHRKSRRVKTSRPVPLDLVDAIRMQAGLERNKNSAQPPEVGSRESFADAPGTSMHNMDEKYMVPLRLDPPKEDNTAAYRVLAPTPRKKTFAEKATEDKDVASNDEKPELDESKHDQWKISERLYGRSSSQDESVPYTRKVASKGVYIGDLINPSDASEPVKTEGTRVAAEEEAEDDAVVPDVTAEANTDNEVENDREENDEKDKEVLDKENEIALGSPKEAINGTTPRRRLGLRGKGGRKSMLSGIRNLMTSSSGNQ